MFYSRVPLYYKVYSFLCFSNLLKNHSFNFLSKRYSWTHWPLIRVWELHLRGCFRGRASLNTFLGLINNFGMSSVIQRQNIKLADLVLMAIADLNSMKLLASPSTIQQHLESKEWFLKSSRTLNARWYICELPRTISVAFPIQNCFNVRLYGPVFANWLEHVMRLTQPLKNSIKSVLYSIY